MKKVVIIFLAAVFMLAMYVPVSAADWNIYGSARVQTFWQDFDEDVDRAWADTTQFTHSLNVVSRFGLMVDHGIVGGHFETGVTPTNVVTRHLYGTVDMPFGDLLIGQTWTLYGEKCFVSCQTYLADDSMLWFVGYGHRRPQVRLTIEDFAIALVEPQRVGFGVDEDGDPIVGANDSEVLLPQVQLGFEKTINDIYLSAVGAFQTYDLYDPAQAWDGETLTAWGVTVSAMFNIIDPMYINLAGFYGQNTLHLGDIYSRYGAEIDGDSIEDTDDYGGLLAIGTFINDIEVQAGVGFTESDNDMWAEKDQMMAYYINANIPISPDGRAFIMPEVGYFDFDDDRAGNDAGSEFYAGLKWQVNF